MGQFQYRAVDQAGRRVDGTVNAASLLEATEQLRAREIDVTAIEAIETTPRRFEPTGSRPASPPRDVEVKLRSQPGGWVLVLVGGIFNRSVRVNGRNPYELVWTFEVDGHRYHDKRSTFDEQAMDFVPGDRIWVLYDSADPEQSAEWPPLG